MGTRGPKPESAAVKRAKGNPSRQPIGADAPAVQLPQVEQLELMPDWMLRKASRKAYAQRVSKYAQQVWRELYDELTRLNLLKRVDQNVFARYCRYFAEWVEYTRIIDEQGPYYETTSPHVGELKRSHPATRLRKDLEQHLKDIEDAIGMRPAARQQIFMRLSAQGQMPMTGSAPGAGGGTDEGDENVPLPFPNSPIGGLSRPN
jgi:P27 family predicted phage terminase small subunit